MVSDSFLQQGKITTCMSSSQLWLMVTLSRAFKVESTQKWFTIPFVWGRSWDCSLLKATQTDFPPRRYSGELNFQPQTSQLDTWYNVMILLKFSHAPTQFSNLYSGHEFSTAMQLCLIFIPRHHTNGSPCKLFL